MSFEAFEAFKTVITSQINSTIENKALSGGELYEFLTEVAIILQQTCLSGDHYGYIKRWAIEYDRFCVLYRLFNSGDERAVDYILRMAYSREFILGRILADKQWDAAKWALSIRTKDDASLSFEHKLPSKFHLDISPTLFGIGAKFTTDDLEQLIDIFGYEDVVKELVEEYPCLLEMEPLGPKSAALSSMPPI